MTILLNVEPILAMLILVPGSVVVHVLPDAPPLCASEYVVLKPDLVRLSTCLMLSGDKVSFVWVDISAMDRYELAGSCAYEETMIDQVPCEGSEVSRAVGCPCESSYDIRPWDRRRIWFRLARRCVLPVLRMIPQHRQNVDDGFPGVDDRVSTAFVLVFDIIHIEQYLVRVDIEPVDGIDRVPVCFLEFVDMLLDYIGVLASSMDVVMPYSLVQLFVRLVVLGMDMVPSDYPLMVLTV